MHDLRNPLISMRGLSELLLMGAFGPASTKEQEEMINTIHSAAEYALSLVNDLLDESAMESGKPALRKEWASLNRVLKERVRMNHPGAEEKDITLSTCMEGELECYFDLKGISRVLDNLVSNAIKYSNPGTNIVIALSRTIQGAKVSIQDEGPGICEEDRAGLFCEFQTLSAKPTAGEKSTGLGLSIVKTIVEAHGGTLEVDSRPGEGSTFTFYLPIEN